MMRRQKLPLVGKELSGLFLKVTRSCEIEVSHIGKNIISYRQRWEKKCLSGYPSYLATGHLFWASSRENVFSSTPEMHIFKSFCPVSSGSFLSINTFYSTE